LDNTTYYKTAQRDTHSDVYLTVVARSPIPDEATVRDFFEEVAAVAVKKGISVVQEKVYGPCADLEMILKARSLAYEKHGLNLEVPPTFIEGAPCIGGLMAGVQMIGVECHTEEARVETIRYQGAPVGHELRLPDCRKLFYAGVSGFDPDTDRNVTEQCGGMFDRAEAMLQDQGLSSNDIVRTWIYMARLLDWYGEFNRVRTGCFTRYDILDSSGKGVLPASTGIQGKRISGEEIFMDVLAIRSDDAEKYQATPMCNASQNEAYDYGSSFSRGMAVAFDGKPELWVSGTASINDEGKTVHHGDEQNQVMATVLAIATLLEGQGSRLRDICQATAYCKGDCDYQAFERIVDHLDLKDIPFVPVLADVCRDELLFEIDSVAIKGLAQRRTD